MTGLRATVTLAASRVCDNRRMTVTIASRALGPASAEVVGSIPGPMAEPR
jgi:hypothetical protein